MWDSEQPVSPEEMPEEACEYAEAIVAYRDHPVIRQYFHQITLCQLPLPDGGAMPFFVLEFRAGNDVAFVWDDGRGNWGVGDWQPLGNPAAAPPLDIDFFQGRPAAPSFAAALEHLRQSRPPAEAS
jgi:hypothetical protein